MIYTEIYTPIFTGLVFIWAFWLQFFTYSLYRRYTDPNISFFNLMYGKKCPVYGLICNYFVLLNFFFYLVRLVLTAFSYIK